MYGTNVAKAESSNPCAFTWIKYVWSCGGEPQLWKTFLAAGFWESFTSVCVHQWIIQGRNTARVHLLAGQQCMHSRCIKVHRKQGFNLKFKLHSSWKIQGGLDILESRHGSEISIQFIPNNPWWTSQLNPQTFRRCNSYRQQRFRKHWYGYVEELFDSLQYWWQKGTVCNGCQLNL